MFRLFQTALVSLVAGTFTCWQTAGIAQDINWNTDAETAISQAANSNKFVLFHFYADWCRPCKQLDTFVFSSSAVIRAIDQHVIPVKVDVDLHPELVKQYGISGIPADVIITPSGRIVQQRVSPKEADGYVDMLNRLARVDRELKAGNKALSQKIDEVLALAKPDTSKVLDHEGFAATAPSHEQAPPSRDSAEMARKFANKFDSSTGQMTTSESDFQPVYVDMTQSASSTTQISASSQASISPTNTAAPSIANQSKPQPSPARVVNQQYLLEKAVGNNAAPAAASISTANNRQFANKKIDTSDFVAPTAQTTNYPAAVRQVNNLLSSAETLSAADRSRFALHGKCPVTLIQKGIWVDGDPQYGCVHRGRLYLFADQSNLLTFQRNPDEFSPMLAGYDPVIYFERGALVDGQEKHGVFMGKLPNQRVILFSSAASREKFQQEPRRYLTVVRQAVKASDDIKTR